MPLFVVETDYGMGIREARTIASARKQALLDCGRDHFRSIRPATDADISWVCAMGGYVPETKKRWRKSRRAPSNRSIRATTTFRAEGSLD